MEPLGNDRFRGSFAIEERADHRYTVVGWIDRFETWRRDLRAKVDARRDVEVDLQAGIELVEAAARRATGARTRPAQGGGTVAGVAEPQGGPRRRLRRGPARADARERRPAPAGVVPARAARDGRRAARRVRRLVRAVPALDRLPIRGGTARSATSIARLAVRRRAGLRRPLPAADPPDRHERTARARTTPPTPSPDDPGQPVGDRRAPRAATPRSTPSSARSTTSSALVARAARARHRDRARHRLPVLARPSLGDASTPSGSGTAPTARSSTPRTRRRSTRTSTRSTSRRADWRALWDALRDVVLLLDATTACASSASTTRTPSRSRSGSGCIAEVRARAPRTRSSWPRRSPGPKVMHRLAKLGLHAVVHVLHLAQHQATS